VPVLVHKFYTAHFNPYLNFHRPCGFAIVTVDAQASASASTKHEHYATPYEKLKLLPHSEIYSFAQLDPTALAFSGTECARRMQRAKQQLRGRGKGALGQGASTADPCPPPPLTLRKEVCPSTVS